MIEYNKYAIAQLVKRVRKKKGLTLKKFAKELDKAESTISMWELCKRTPPTKIVFWLLEQDGVLEFREINCPTCHGTGKTTTIK